MRESTSSTARTITGLLIMLIAFAVLGAFFIALDSASGVHVRLPSLFVASGPGRTPTPHPTAARATPRPSPSPTIGTVSPTSTASAGITGTATATATSTAPISPTTTPSPFPAPPGGITPPHYSVLLDFPNNTSFTPAFMRSLDTRIIALTNDQRAAHGLGKLTESTALDFIAAARCEDMIARSYFDHYDPTGAVDAQGRHAAAVQELLARDDIAYTEVGENLVGNTDLPLDARSPGQVVRAWMNHPEHRANILHAAYTTIGVGMAAQNQATGLRVIITQVFVR